jgi:hypothetical protein
MRQSIENRLLRSKNLSTLHKTVSIFSKFTNQAVYSHFETQFETVDNNNTQFEKCSKNGPIFSPEPNLTFKPLPIDYTPSHPWSQTYLHQYGLYDCDLFSQNDADNTNTTFSSLATSTADFAGTNTQDGPTTPLFANNVMISTPNDSSIDKRSLKEIYNDKTRYKEGFEGLNYYYIGAKGNGNVQNNKISHKDEIIYGVDKDDDDEGNDEGNEYDLDDIDGRYGSHELVHYQIQYSIDLLHYLYGVRTPSASLTENDHIEDENGLKFKFDRNRMVLSGGNSNGGGNLDYGGDLIQQGNRLKPSIEVSFEPNNNHSDEQNRSKNDQIDEISTSPNGWYNTMKDNKLPVPNNHKLIKKLPQILNFNESTPNYIGRLFGEQVESNEHDINETGLHNSLFVICFLNFYKIIAPFQFIPLKNSLNYYNNYLISSKHIVLIQDLIKIKIFNFRLIEFYFNFLTNFVNFVTTFKIEQKLNNLRIFLDIIFFQNSQKFFPNCYFAQNDRFYHNKTTKDHTNPLYRRVLSQFFAVSPFIQHVISSFGEKSEFAKIDPEKDNNPAEILHSTVLTDDQWMELFHNDHL